MEESERRKRIDISLSPEAIERAKAHAAELGLNLSAYIEMLIRKARGMK